MQDWFGQLISAYTAASFQILLVWAVSLVVVIAAFAVAVVWVYKSIHKIRHDHKISESVERDARCWREHVRDLRAKAEASHDPDARYKPR